MRKYIVSLIVFICVFSALSVSVWASPGDMGFFGGITEGVPLPKAIEEILAGNAAASATAPISSSYSEIIFIGGRPAEFTGQISIRKGGAVNDADSGQYRVTYDIFPGNATDANAILDRNIVFDVQWYRIRELEQVIKSFSVAGWSEVIVVDGQTFVLDPALSFFDVSVLEDHTAGVMYYKGNTSYRAVYFSGGLSTTIEGNSQFWGYKTAWSHAETHRISEQVLNDEWQMAYEVRPSVSAFKTLQYSRNEPQLISFPGNYQEVLTTESGLAYNIYHLPNQFYGTPLYGTANLDSINVFDNLPYVDTSMYAADWAHQDIARLYALSVLDQPVPMFVPSSLITRSQFVTMLVKALKIPIEPPQPSSNRRRDSERIVFPDITRERPDYAYIMAAWDSGLVVGKGGGQFCPDDYVTIEEAVHMVVTALGLLRLGIEPTNMTPFSDDADISPWAKQALYAGRRIGLITPQLDGTINPGLEMTKAAGAAIINRLIDYMRTELLIDYTEHIVHFAW
ncbi:MAG: S-layer homology domain-containing protein [Defluviitaleaceae bacterium]|nr:S-layer homology domain-containing protein [Defluviitaleaceae bacterium]MCL2835990.1 S-layer homology domain-containing protein [Defluviitaleaceae bacterium]